MRVNRETEKRKEVESESEHIPNLIYTDDNAVTSGTSTVIVEVKSSATGGGYYNCKLQVFDATYWNTNTDPLSDTGDSIIVLNLVERGTSNHRLVAGDLIMCWKITDDEGNARYVGQEIFGRNDFDICT